MQHKGGEKGGSRMEAAATEKVFILLDKVDIIFILDPGPRGLSSGSGS